MKDKEKLTDEQIIKEMIEKVARVLGTRFCGSAEICQTQNCIDCRCHKEIPTYGLKAQVIYQQIVEPLEKEINRLKEENNKLIIELKARANINADDFDEMQTLRRATFELKAENERLLKVIEEKQLTFNTTQGNKYSVFDTVRKITRKETAEKIYREL